MKPSLRRARLLAAEAQPGRRRDAEIYDPRVRSRKRWNDLSPRARRLTVAAAVVEGLLKTAALIDLARRPARDVRGSKAAWAAAVSLLNAAGAAPVAYFAWGRRRP